MVQRSLDANTYSYGCYRSSYSKNVFVSQRNLVQDVGFFEKFHSQHIKDLVPKISILTRWIGLKRYI